MKIFYFLLLLTPVGVWAQSDTLKPINSDLIPAYGGRYGQHVRTQYTYDGLDIRPKAASKYIYASGDPQAIHEIQKYMTSRHVGGLFIATGIISMITGGAIMSSNRPNSDGTFYTNQPIGCPVGYYCGSTSGTPPTMKVYDSKRANRNGAGGVVLLAGSILTGIGWGMQLPGKHVRHAVQYYNRALRQRGLSLRLEPRADYSSAGIGLVARF